MEDREIINKLYRTTNMDEFVMGIESLSIRNLEKILKNAISKQQFEIAVIIKDRIGFKKQTDGDKV